MCVGERGAMYQRGVAEVLGEESGDIVGDGVRGRGGHWRPRVVEEW